MDFKKYFQQGIEIVKLNEKTIDTVAKDKKATNMAILFFAIGGGILGLLTFNPAAFIFGALFTAGFSFIWTGILHLLAKILGGKAGFMEFYRPLGIGNILSWLAFIPVLGQIIWLWTIVIEIFVLRKVHKLTTLKAVIIVLLPLILLLAIIFVVAATFLVGLFTLIGASGGLETFLNNCPWCP